MKEEGPGPGQGLRLRQPQREITPERRRGEGAPVPGRDPGLAPGPGQETEAGRRLEEALQEPGQDPQDQEATRGLSAILITPPVAKAAVEEEEAEEEVETRKGRLRSLTSVWACSA